MDVGGAVCLLVVLFGVISKTSTSKALGYIISLIKSTIPIDLRAAECFSTDKPCCCRNSNPK